MPHHTKRIVLHDNKEPGMSVFVLGEELRWSNLPPIFLLLIFNHLIVIVKKAIYILHSDNIMHSFKSISE